MPNLAKRYWQEHPYFVVCVAMIMTWTIAAAAATFAIPVTDGRLVQPLLAMTWFADKAWIVAIALFVLAGVAEDDRLRTEARSAGTLSVLLLGGAAFSLLIAFFGVPAMAMVLTSAVDIQQGDFTTPLTLFGAVVGIVIVVGWVWHLVSRRLT